MFCFSPALAVVLERHEGSGLAFCSFRDLSFPSFDFPCLFSYISFCQLCDTPGLFLFFFVSVDSGLDTFVNVDYVCILA